MSGHITEERFVVTAEARRRWSRAEKAAMVSQIVGSTVSAVARRHHIAPSLLFRWKREFGGRTPPKPGESAFVRVALPAPVMSEDAGMMLAAGADDGTIEIVLTGDRRVIVGKNADMATLRRVIAVLEER